MRRQVLSWGREKQGLVEGLAIAGKECEPATSDGVSAETFGQGLASPIMTQRQVAPVSVWVAGGLALQIRDAEFKPRIL
jgi:hypothetical protein